MSGEVLWNNELVQASNYTINPNETIHLLTSAEVANGGGNPFNSLKVTMEYAGLTPNQGSGRIGVIVEAKDALGAWSPIGYQFSPVANLTSQAPKRIIIVQPDMDTFNLGIDDIVYPVDSEVARISREQGSLPATAYRVCVLLTDSDPTGPGAFQEVTISGTGEMYNV